MPAELDLGYGLKLRADSRHVWLIFPPTRRSTPDGCSTINLSTCAQRTPAFVETLLGFLEEHMPEASADVRGYLERIAATQARLTAPDFGEPKKSPAPDAGA